MMTRAFLMFGVFCLLVAQTLAQDKIKVELKDGPKPDIYIDGKKYDYAIFDLLDQTKIESIDVIKGEQALKEYDAENGVILIQSKNAVQQNGMGKIQISSSDKEPVFMVDGEISDRETVSKLYPDDIKSVSVFKGQDAIDKYNAPNGVVIITTKQK
ncbi:MAG: hypothetical protein RLQ12_22495 [Cyclobacteriaceae bacterium]